MACIIIHDGITLIVLIWKQKLKYLLHNLKCKVEIFVTQLKMHKTAYDMEIRIQILKMIFLFYNYAMHYAGGPESMVCRLVYQGHKLT